MPFKTLRRRMEFRVLGDFRGSQTEYSFRSVLSDNSLSPTPQRSHRVPPRPKVLVVILALFVLPVLPSAVGARTADDPVLTAQVGSAAAHEAFRITLTDASGQAVTRIP